MGKEKQNLLETGATGLLVSMVTGAITLAVILLAGYAILPIKSKAAEIMLLSLIAGLTIALQLWIQGQLSAKLYQKKDREYVSKWNLAAAYPIAAAIYSTFILVLGVWSLFLGYGFRLPENITILGGALIAGVGLLAYLVAIGSALNWTNSWTAKTGKVATLCIGALSFVIITGLTGALITGGGVNLSTESQGSANNPSLEAELSSTAREVNSQLRAGYYLKADPAGKLYQCKDAQAEPGGKQCIALKLSLANTIEAGVDDYWPQSGSPRSGEAINQVIIRKASNPQCSALIEQDADGKIIRQNLECN